MAYIRNTILVICVLLVAVAAWWLVPRAAQGYKAQGPGETYLALGDSLAWGASLAAPQDESYPALLHKRLIALGPSTLANLAIPGETSASLRGQQLRRAIGLIERERAAGQRVSPITIDIGGNDLQRVASADVAGRAAAVEEIRRNIAATLTALQDASGGSADIAIMLYYNPYGGDSQQANSEAYWVVRLNAAIAEEAASHGAAVADAYTPFDGGREYTYTNILLGDVHANRQGHVVMAEQFWAALGYR